MPDPITLVPAKRKASEGVKTQLLRAMEYAEREGATAVAIAFVFEDGACATIIETGENVWTLIGAVQALNQRLLEQ